MDKRALASDDVPSQWRGVMPKRAAVTEAEAKRVMKAAIACGLKIKEVVVSVDCVRLVTDAEAEERHKPDKEMDTLKKAAIAQL